MTVFWTSVGLGVDEDPALVTVKQCTILSPPETFNVAYTVKAMLPLFSWTGYNVAPTGKFSFNLLSVTREQQQQIQTVASTILDAFKDNPAPFKSSSNL